MVISCCESTYSLYFLACVRFEKDGLGPKTSSEGSVSRVTDAVAKLNIGKTDQKSEPPSDHDIVSNIECKCGMPLCICQPPTPPPKADEVCFPF